MSLKYRIFRKWRVSVWLFLLLSAGACDWLRSLPSQRLVKPKVTVDKLTFQGVKGESLELRAVLTVDNPNNFEMKFGPLNHELSINSRSMAVGSRPDSMVIKPSGRTEILLPIIVDTSQAWHLLREVLFERKPLELHWKVKTSFLSSFGATPIFWATKKTVKSPKQSKKIRKK